jgi:hypothetical protein
MALKKEKTCFTTFPLLHLENSSDGKKMEFINPIVCLRKRERNMVEQSDTFQDLLCEFLQRKFFKENDIVVIS